MQSNTIINKPDLPTDMIDITEPENVEVVVSDDKVWININGICAFRAYKCENIEVVCLGEVDIEHVWEDSYE